MNTRIASLVVSALLLGFCACKGNGHDAGEGKEVPVGKQPAVSLAAGIAAAQKSAPGMQFLAAEIENEGGKVICSVVFVKADGASEVNIDATSGAVVNTENEKIHDKTKALLQELAKDPKLASTTAAQAIDAALKKLPGTWAIEARLTKEAGLFVYEIALAGGKEPMLAQVSAADGMVKKVSELEEENEEAEEGEKPEAKENK
jgi:uncharacterized membrane protein YkoI